MNGLECPKNNFQKSQNYTENSTKQTITIYKLQPYSNYSYEIRAHTTVGGSTADVYFGSTEEGKKYNRIYQCEHKLKNLHGNFSFNKHNYIKLFRKRFIL